MLLLRGDDVAPKGTAAGTSTALAVGRATARSVGSASGLATVTGVGQSSAPSPVVPTSGIKRVQYGSITFANGDVIGSVTIIGVNPNKAVLFHSGQNITTGSGIADGFIRISLSLTGTSVNATRAGNSQAATVNFAVREYY